LYHSADIPNLVSEEKILAELVRGDRGQSYRLRSYIHNFLAIIEFDAERKGRSIPKKELDWYAATLGKAVTDGIQHFVCHGHPYPESDNRYLAAHGAHIVHMLRDMLEDIPEGYINIPQEQLKAYDIDLQNFEAKSLRPWVKERVQLAREYFAEGKQYLNDLPVLRCRIVGYWYCARFETLLNTIEADDYVLRWEYPKSNKLLTWVKFAGIALGQIKEHALHHLRHDSGFCSWRKDGVEKSLNVVPK
jgi:hypothetical protein